MSGLTVESQANEFEYYLQQVHEMDKFIGDITKALKKFGEPTILVMYGDHLPGLQTIAASNLVNNNIFQTQYVMWNNFGLKKQDKDLYAYQLGAEVLNRIGIHDGVMTKYHQDHEKDASYLTNLKALQYDMLYGKDYIFGGKESLRADRHENGRQGDQGREGRCNRQEILHQRGRTSLRFSKISIDGKVLDTIFLGPSVLGLLEEVKTGGTYPR